MFQLLHEGFVYSNERKVSNLFNDYFCNIYNSLNSQYWKPDAMHTINQINNPVEKCIAKFDLHPSIKNRSHFTPNLFEFRKISTTDMRKYVMKLGSKKNKQAEAFLQEYSKAIFIA